MGITKATKTAVEKDFKPKVAAIKEKSTTVGSDPELFVRKTPNYKTVTGAEKLLTGGEIVQPNGCGKIIIDGVQLELNPNYSTGPLRNTTTGRPSPSWRRSMAC